MGKSSEKSTVVPEPAGKLQPSAFSRALGARLRELREERGWSQRELGSRLGILQSKLSKYESGTHQPSLRTLVRMANIFAVSTDYLLTGAGTPAPPLRDERLLDRFRRLGAGGEELRSIVLSILDAMVELGAYLEQRHAGGDTAAAPAAPGAAGASRSAARNGRAASWSARRGKAVTPPRTRPPRRAATMEAAVAAATAPPGGDP